MAFKDVNICVFTGRLFGDPESRVSANGTTVAEFSLAVNKRSKNEDESPNSLRFVAFNKTAEFVEKYLKKGTKILVRSHVDTGSYEKESGEKAYSLKFIIDEVTFAGKKKDDNSSAETAAETDLEGFVNVPDGIEMDLPFG